jgi:hypothetical protein
MLAPKQVKNEENWEVEEKGKSSEAPELKVNCFSPNND